MGRCLPLPPPARRVCAKARHAMWQVHVVQHPNVAFSVDAHTLFDEARRENDAVHHRGAHFGAWVALAVLVDAHIGIEICLSCPSRTVLGGSSVIPAEELLVREHHARQVQGLQMPFATNREHTHVNRGARTRSRERAKEEAENCLSNHHHHHHPSSR